MNIARDICPCIWITSPDETTYILKTILRLAGVSIHYYGDNMDDDDNNGSTTDSSEDEKMDRGNYRRETLVNLKTVASRNAMMDVYTGEMLSSEN